jgi:hypothetical protein
VAPEQTAHAAQLGHCKTGYWVKKPVNTPQWAVVGELNNAYNDGTAATFTYARDHTADTDFSVAVSSDGGETFELHGQTHIGDYGKVVWPTFRRRFARKMRSKFQFTLEAARADTCAVWSEKIHATAWLSGTDFTIKQAGTLDKCDSSWVGGSAGAGSEWERDHNDAVRWTRGVSAFGVELTSQSGFSTHVVTHYVFGGPENKMHYVCGPNGRQSPFLSGRIFSGARK